MEIEKAEYVNTDIVKVNDNIFVPCKSPSCALSKLNTYVANGGVISTPVVVENTVDKEMDIISDLLSVGFGKLEMGQIEYFLANMRCMKDVAAIIKALLIEQEKLT